MCKGVSTMGFSFLVFIGILTIPIWGIVFCLNLITIIEKINMGSNYSKNTFWFTISFVVIITVLTIIIAIPAPPVQ